MEMTEEQRRMKVLDGIDALCYKYFFRLESDVILRSISGDSNGEVVTLSLREMYNKKTQQHCAKMGNLSMQIKKLKEENNRLANQLDKYKRREHMQQLDDNIHNKK